MAPAETESQDTVEAWWFSVPRAAVAVVGGAPTNDRAAEYFALAVPELARQLDPVTRPCVVTGHITAPGRGRAPGGPKGRAKAFLDALHDGRRTGPSYHHIGSCPPLAGDDPVHLTGLALEVAAGPARTEYLIGDQLRVRGELLAEVPVHHPAPNDIAGSRQEQAAISDSRTNYGRAVRAAFRCHAPVLPRQPGAVVIRHHPQRDEDNTWETWLAAILGPRADDQDHWAAGAPLSGWKPTSVASLADSQASANVTYQLWG